MTAREYARLQGAPDFKSEGFPESQVLFAMGDAVCVPVVRWIAKHYLVPLVLGTPRRRVAERSGVGRG